MASDQVSVSARETLSREVVRSAREGDGWPVEADGAVNDASRAVVAEVAAANDGEAWLGKINLYDKERHGGHPIMWRWDGGLVYNFDAAFVAPRHDAELVRLIADRDDAPYEGTRRDAQRIDAIFDRLAAVGGVHLFWT